MLAFRIFKYLLPQNCTSSLRHCISFYTILYISLLNFQKVIQSFVLYESSININGQKVELSCKIKRILVIRNILGYCGGCDQHATAFSSSIDRQQFIDV